MVFISFDQAGYTDLLNAEKLLREQRGSTVESATGNYGTLSITRFQYFIITLLDIDFFPRLYDSFCRSFRPNVVH